MSDDQAEGRRTAEGWSREAGFGFAEHIDRAQAREDEFRADSIEAWARRAKAARAKESAMHCRVCEERIPSGRRLAVPGVQTCIACQAELEQAMRINA